MERTLNADPEPCLISSSLVVVDDVTCVACGCLCDDLRVTVENDRVRDIQSACEIGRNWYASRATSPPQVLATVDGEGVSMAEAIEQTVSIFRNARNPVVYGMTTCFTESIREALGLAERLKARVVLGRSAKELRRVSAYQNQGRVTATLGEVKNRADVVVFWRTNPVLTHPRHFERYSADCPGRFVAGGRAGRTIIVVDSKETETAEVADRFIRIDDDSDLVALSSLRGLVRGRRIPSRDQLSSSQLEPLIDLSAALLKARYGALFYDEPPEMMGRGSQNWEAATKLVRDLNEMTRFVMLGLGRAGNLAGAEAALTWQTGFLQGVNHATGTGRASDDLQTLDDVLSSGEPDAILRVMDDWPMDLSDRARSHLASIHRVVIGPDVTCHEVPSPTIALTSATPGFDASGTVTRVDGVSLPVRCCAKQKFPTDREWIRLIHDHYSAGNKTC